ncbi:hypothetical protein [uncultured Lacinutrix sp.]|uniref:hypothetical protein n=1 Tax=uncultured Lacinutrix sp. TaxID=574032 RepID=UPI0026031EEA|nr:hypothetical protein [uncultured Lacinutrix sp.]
MKYIQYTLLVAITIGFVTFSYSQSNHYDIKNGISIAGGLTQYDIVTDNFNTKKGNGWAGGLTASVILPHKWYGISYGMQLAENNFSVEGRKPEALGTIEDINYKLLTAQLAFLLHVKVVKSYLTLDVGPMLQYNADLQLKDKAQENYLINNFETVTADDIRPISRFNVNGAIGATAGFSSFKLKAQYIYGFLNTLNKLNDQPFNSTDQTTFKGNQSMLVFTAMITF